MAALEGQMNSEERNLIKQLIIQKKPKVVFEIGTWKGGGSTLSIASGLFENKSGVLYTCETEKAFFQQAVESFNEYFQEYKPFVIFHNESSSIILKSLIEENKIPDFILLDGIAARQKEDVNDMNSLEKYLSDGTIIAYHDSKIQLIVNDYFSTHKNWKKIHEVNSSTGFTVCEFKK